MVRQRSAKPLFAGSNPAVASKFSLPVPPNFSFPSTVESHGWYRLAPFQWSSEKHRLHRPEALSGGVVELTIRSGKGRLLVEVAHSAKGFDETELASRLSRMFQLHVDTREFVEMTRSSPAHAWVAESGFGRLLCGSTLFEDIVKIIATTNTMWRQTVRMIDLLTAKCGRRGAFPDPPDIARFTPDELQRDCRLGYRAKSIHALASGIVRGTIDLDRLSDPTQTTAGLFESYRTLPGIGPYGAAHLLAMDGRHDFIAVDTEFRRFVRDRYHGGRRVSDLTMLRRYARWGRWKYLAYWAELWGSVAAGLQPDGTNSVLLTDEPR